MNGTKACVSGDILFPSHVMISDLANQISQGRPARPESNFQDARQAASQTAKRFSLDVPPSGVLPLAVDRVGFSTRAENDAADALENFDLHSANAASAAMSELPGLEQMNSEESLALWN
jgi:hypothetical protein